jgi:uncharacterized protein (DUF1697 family)
MPTHIALLRGVNVGGNLLKMERLRELCAELGFQNARTYVQSGNVVFENAAPASQCRQRLERKLAGETRLPASVVLRTIAELRQILDRNPFLKVSSIDLSKLHVTFLAGAATKSAIQQLGKVNAAGDDFRAIGSEVYLHCPNGYGRTRLSNTVIEKALGVRATTRNWNTVNKLYELATT